MRKGLAILLAFVIVIVVSAVGFAWEAKCVYGTPVIDGEADSVWEYTDPIIMNANTTISGTCKVLWDEEYMYYLFEMNDDAQFVMGGAEGNDSVEIWIDEGNLNQFKRNETVGNNDFHYRIDIDGTVSSNENDTEDCTVGMSATDTTYIIEISVPYHSIEPVDGYVMGFTPSANTDDDGDGSRDDYINSNAGEYWDDPSVYDDLVFVKLEGIGTIEGPEEEGNSMVWIYIAIAVVFFASIVFFLLGKKMKVDRD